MAELTFKSPGVSTREIDLSQPSRTGPVGIPAGVIGTALEGPAFVPLTFANFSDFAKTFGKTDGEKFGPLAVHQWLNNAQAATYIRVLGAGNGRKRITAGDVTNAGFIVGNRIVQENGVVSNNAYANSGAGAPEGRTYMLGCFMSESLGSTVFSDAGLQKTTAASGISATAVNAIDTDGAYAGINGGTDVSFTINVPTDAGGEGGIITITLTDTDDTGAAGAGANAIGIGGNSGLGDASWQNLVLAAINGDTSSGRITMATSGRGQSGVGGVTATNGTSNTQTTLTIDQAGANGNSAALASTAGVNIIDVTSFTGGVSGNHAVPILRGVLLAPSGVILHLSGGNVANDNIPLKSATAADGSSKMGRKGSLTGSVNIASQEFVLLMNGYSNSDTSKKTHITASFDMTSPNYFANVFNTNPHNIEKEGHLLYAHYDVYPDLAVVTGSGIVTPGTEINGGTKLDLAFLLSGSNTRNTDSASNVNYESFQDRFNTASTPFVTSQTLGGVKKNLFKIHLLSPGKNTSNRYKFSIENVRKSSSLLDEYGTFDLVVRDFNDSDNERIVLESFRGVDLDPSSDRYIGRIVGDQHIFYNFDADPSSQKIVVDGTHPVRSRYIRVEVHTDVANNNISKSALPFGFRGHSHLVTSGSVLAGEDSTNYSVSNIVRAVSEIPNPLRESVTQGSGIQKRIDGRLYWGIQFERKTDATLPNKSDLQDTSIQSFAKYFPNFKTSGVAFSVGNNAGTANVAGSVLDSDLFNRNAFNLENIQIRTGSNGKADPSQWHSASYVRAGNISANATNKTRAFNVDDLSAVGNIKYAKFTFFSQGGFDGVNIFDEEKSKLSNTAIKREENEDAGINSNTVSAYRKALDIMSSKTDVDIQLLAVPGIRHTSVTDYAIQKIEERFDALYIMDIEETDQNNTYITSSAQKPSVTRTVSQFEGRGLDSSFAAAYFPDVTVTDPSTQAFVQAPPSVAVLGAYAFNDTVAHPWFAPAGFSRGALNSVELASVKLNRTNLDDLYESDINPIVEFPGVGITIWGQKTLQSANSALDRVNVRRLLIDVRRKVKNIANTLLFEPNREETLDRFNALVNPILQRIQEQSGVERYKAVIDTSTTTQADVENNTIRGKIFLQPTRSVEFVALDFVVTNAGSNI